MQQKIETHHFVDNNQNPSGGQTYGPGLTIAWQNGPLAVNGKREEPNGCFVETVIIAAIDRLEFYQQTQLRNDFNARAIGALKSALAHLDQRTATREAAGIAGTHTPDPPAYSNCCGGSCGCTSLADDPTGAPPHPIG